MRSNQEASERMAFERRLSYLEGDDPSWLTVAFAHLKALCESRIS